MHTDHISGDYYDWTLTMQPEQPYRHAYHLAPIIKISLADKRPGNACKVHLTFAQALDVIRRLDALTLGMPKIVYLVGWQFLGHDSKYPSWDTVNTHLKRPEDATATDSLRWLMAEARNHHTTVSLHINMIDAFEDSPLWPQYLAQDVIAKDTHGNPLKGEVFGGWIGPETQSYQISYAREWHLGLAQQRIDRLINMLPLKQAGTIHIDAFHSHAPLRPGDDAISPLCREKYGYTVGEEIRTQRKIIRYWQSHGIDVTAECNAYWLRRDPFVGLQAAAWHFNPLNGVIPSLQCGTPMQAENEIFRDPETLAGLREAFCSRALPWIAKNAGGIPNYHGPLVDGNDIFIPLPWQPDAIVAYSAHGCTNKRWPLPPSLSHHPHLQASQLTPTGPQPLTTIPTQNHSINLTLTPQSAILLTPT